MMDFTLPVRAERYAFELLDLARNRVGLVPGVRSCRLDWSIYNTVRGSGDLDVITRTPLDWPAILVRPWVLVGNVSGQAAIPLLTGLCRVPDQTFTPKGVEAQVELHDRTMALSEWILRETYTIPAGAKLTDRFADVLLALGYTSADFAVTPSSSTTAGPMVWAPGASDEGGEISWLRVLNDMCKALGYVATWADARGQFQFHPYRPPASRTPSARFADDGKSLRYLPSVNVATREFEMHNEWTVWSKAEGDTAPVSATARNEDPAHPYSTTRLGRVVSAPPRRDVVLASGVTLQSVAEQARVEAMADQRTFRISARFAPVVEHDAVELVNADATLATVATVASRSLNCVPGAHLGLTLREVSP